MSPQLAGKLEALLVEIIGETMRGLAPAEQVCTLSAMILQPMTVALLRCGVRPWVLVNGLRSIGAQMPHSDDPAQVVDVLAAKWSAPRTWRYR